MKVYVNTFKQNLLGWFQIFNIFSLPDQISIQLFFYQNSNLMKEAVHQINTLPASKTRNGACLTTTSKVHERGDKVVVNGAKQSMLAILRRQTCQCSKHNLEKLTLKFLTQNKITASYDILVWMIIFLMINCEPILYSCIVEEYIKKMQKKKNEDESHQSERYVQSKKQTLQKFIESAEILLTDHMNLNTIERSVGALYSKGKSKENALGKIKVYLSKIGFQDCLQFQESSCSFKKINQTEEESLMSDETNQNNNSQTSSSNNFEDKIQKNSPLQEKTTEEIPITMPEDYPNMSYRLSLKQPSYDLFEELIQSDESAYSLLSQYLFQL